MSNIITDMQRCTCNSRALELFINDVAGIRIRQLNAQRFFYQTRRLGTSGSARQLAAVERAHEGYIPFNTKPVQERAHGISESSNNEAQRAARRQADDGDKDQDWHAEIQIVAPSLPAEHEIVAARGDEVHQPMNDGDATRVNDTVDSVALQGLHPRVERAAGLPTPPILLQTPPVGAIITLPQKSKAESRQERKQRRVQAGTYRQLAEAQKKEATTLYQVQTVLDKLDHSEDPRPERKEALEKFKKQRAAMETGRKKDSVGVKASVKAKDTTSTADARPGASRSDKDTRTPQRPRRETWQTQKEALEQKFGETGWQPRKRLSPDTIEGIRAMHASDPASYSTQTLSEHFKVTPEAIRRILKSKWRPNDEEAQDRRVRWERRGANKWQAMAEKGARPPAKWRALGAGGEEGLKDDRMPKRKKRSRADENLSWDDVVGGTMHEEEIGFGKSFAERIL